MRHRNRVLLIVLTLLLHCAVAVTAETWHDDFEVENREAWRAVGTDAIWQVRDGLLYAEVKREWDVEYELYEFIALSPPYRNFTITLTDFGGDKTRFGFCVGRRFPDTAEEDPFFYVFFPDEIRARRFDGEGSSHPFRTRLSREPRLRWETDTLSEMQLQFNSGHFAVFGDGEFRTAFSDANFATVEILGFVMEGINIANEWEGTGWVDAFRITGLNISAEVRLTQLWGHLKLGR